MLQSRASRAGPNRKQSLPLCRGAGLLHFLDLTLSPPPHVREHVENFDHSPYPPSTGQGCVLQGAVSSGDPRRVQSWPPASGVGFVQLRILNCVPPAQDFVHGLNSDHGVYPPLTGHGWVLHGQSSFGGPKREQFLPSPTGAGSLHSLFLVLSPLPQVLVQELNSPQLP